MDSFNEAWDIICDYCRQRITDVAYKTWISKIEPVNLDFSQGKAILMVPGDFHRQTLTRCYMSLLNDAFESVFGSGIDICFTIPEEINQKEEKLNESILDADYEFTFDTFIVGSSNKFAHAASLAVAANPGYAYNPLFIYGNSGLGKTHLLNPSEVKSKQTALKKKLYMLRVMISLMNLSNQFTLQKQANLDKNTEILMFCSSMTFSLSVVRSLLRRNFSIPLMLCMKLKSK